LNRQRFKSGILIDKDAKSTYYENMLQLQRSIIPIDILEEIITLGEGYKAEFETTLGEGGITAKTLCAFSNSKGGNLFIGIHDSGEPVGVRDKYLELTKIDKALALLIPKPDILLQSVIFNNFEIIILEVREGKNKPYFVNISGKLQAFIRTGAENIPATKKEIKAFMNNIRILSSAYRNLNCDEKILFDLFEQERRLALSEIREKLNYSERQMKKALTNLYKLGLVVPSLSDKEVYYRTDHA